MSTFSWFRGKFHIGEQKALGDLLEAIKEGDEKGVATILRHNPTIVNLEAEEERVLSPMAQAIERGLNQGKASKRTPLFVAAGRASPAIVADLIDAGADVNKQSWHNQTPLHTAVMNGRVETVALLVKHGASCDLLDSNYKNPLEYLDSLDATRDAMCAALGKLLPPPSARLAELMDELVANPTEEKQVNALEICLYEFKYADSKRIDELRGHVRRIGEQINTAGGFSGMLSVHDKLQRSTASGARTIERLWGGIGDWRR
jgi:hypothetical protein